METTANKTVPDASSEDHQLRKVLEEMISEGGSDQEIASELSSYGKERLVGAFRGLMESRVKTDPDSLLSALEQQDQKQWRGLNPVRFEVLLDRRRKQKTPNEGDFLVRQKEVHEQLFIVRSEWASGPEEAARYYLNEDGIRYGRAKYQRLLETEDPEVAEVGGGPGVHVDPDNRSE